VVFDVARTFYTVFAECGVLEDPTKSPGRDVLFRQFFDDLEKEQAKLSDTDFQNYVDKRIALEVTSRVLYLQLLFERFEDITPEKYLLSQLNGASQAIFNIQSILGNESGSDLRRLLEGTLAVLSEKKKLNGKLIFAIDEVNVGYNILRGKFRNNRNNHPRGALSPFISFLANLPYKPSILYAGTALSMTLSDTIQSDIGKVSDVSIIMDFPFLDVRQGMTFAILVMFLLILSA
jgi:hypothetical protein